LACGCFRQYDERPAADSTPQTDRARPNRAGPYRQSEPSQPEWPPMWSQASTLVTLKALSTLTVTFDPSALVMCAS
jgi:hypothetical protein